MSVQHVTDETFTQEVGQEGLVLADFWAPWCGPCKMLAPVLDELDSTSGEKVKIIKINVDENPDTAGQFGVMSIPTLVLFKDGVPVDKTVGLKSREALEALVDRHV